MSETEKMLTEMLGVLALEPQSMETMMRRIAGEKAELSREFKAGFMLAISDAMVIVQDYLDEISKQGK